MASKPAWFWHWVAWRLRNKRGPRPADVPAKIPDWAWAALEHWVARHKPKPPPPPTPPPPPPPKPIVFTAWDPSEARQGNWTVLEIVAQDGSWAVWGAEGIWLAQAEDASQHDKSVAYLKGKTGHRAVVATQGGWMNPQPFLDIGVNVCFGEAYQNDDPGHTPNEITWQEDHDGWPYAYPVVGCYHGYALSNYNLAPWGKNFGVYLAEEMTDDDWRQLAVLAG